MTGKFLEKQKYPVSEASDDKIKNNANGKNNRSQTGTKKAFLPVSFFSLLRVVLCLAPREEVSEVEAAPLGPEGGGLASAFGVT